jgi:hypothetical protein
MAQSVNLTTIAIPWEELIADAADIYETPFIWEYDGGSPIDH